MHDALLIFLSSVSAVAIAFAVLHVAAFLVCRKKGHEWSAEYTLKGIEPIADRCRRCRVWR